VVLDTTDVRAPAEVYRRQMGAVPAIPTGYT
jgi:hypothetical protein